MPVLLSLSPITLLLTVQILSIFTCCTAQNLEQIDCSRSENSENTSARSALNVLLVAPADPEYFQIWHQLPAICYALSYLRKFENLRLKYEISLLYLEASHDGSDNDVVRNVFTNESYAFVSVMGPDLDFLEDIVDTTPTLSTTAIRMPFISYLQQLQTKPADHLNSSPSNFFRAAPLIYPLTNLYQHVFQTYSWDRAMLIYQTGIDNWAQMSYMMYYQFAKYGIELHIKTILPYTDQPHITSLVNSIGPEGLDFKIIILLLHDDAAAKLVCQLRKAGIAGPEYAIFGQITWDHKSWMQYGTNCTMNEYQDVLEHSFYPDMSGIGWNSNRETDLQVKTSDYVAAMLYSMNNESDEVRSVHVYESGFVADATWSLLTALDQSVEQNETDNYNDFHDLIVKNLANVSFQGISGTVAFNEDGNRSEGFYACLYQMIGDCLSLTVTMNLPDQIVNNKIDFRDNIIPSTNRQFTTANMQLMDFFIMIPAVSGAVFCAFSILTYLVFRNKPGIKLLSPKINILCGLGSAVTFGTILAHMWFNVSRQVTVSKSLDTKTAWGCTGYDLALRAGFFMAFGSIVAKLYRVHKIFNFKSRNNRVPSDRTLILIVIAGTMVDVAVSLVEHLVSPPIHILLHIHVSNPDSSDQDDEDPVNFLACSRPKTPVKYIGYMADLLLLLMAVYLSWATRKVKIYLLNESQKVGSIVITVIALQILRILSLLSFQDDATTMSTFFTVTENTIAVHWIIAAQVFLPGIVRLLVKPNWKPDTSIAPAHLDNMTEIRNDPSKLHEIEQILDMYVKTCEIWSQMREREKRIDSMYRKVMKKRNSESSDAAMSAYNSFATSLRQSLRIPNLTGPHDFDNIEQNLLRAETSNERSSAIDINSS